MWIALYRLELLLVGKWRRLWVTVFPPCEGVPTLTSVPGSCGDTIIADPARGADSVCNVPCRDDPNQSCGGLKMLKRAQKAVAAYSSVISLSSTATTPQRSSTATASSASLTGSLSSSPRVSFSRYANTTSSTSSSTTATSATSQSVTASSGTSSLPYGCTDLLCVSQSNAGRNGAGSAPTSSLPFGCASKFSLSDLVDGIG